ncbi:MAG: sigma-70 family RNA polymerase sigma factor, partial [Candidatus Cryptobacteroides sp.]
PLCLYALHYVEDIDAAEDIVQEAFLAYWNHFQGSSAPVSPKAYLYTSVRNFSIDILRKKAPGKVALDKIPIDTEAVINDEEAQSRSESEARLWSAIDRLPAQRRQMLLMSKRDGMKYSEIALELGLSAFTVRNQISRALASLRKDTGLNLKTLLFLLG